MHSALKTLDCGLWTLKSNCGSSRKASIIPSSWAFWGLHVASMTTKCWMANPLRRQRGSAINLSGLRNWAFLKGPPLRRQGVGRLEVRLDTCWSTATIEIQHTVTSGRLSRAWPCRIPCDRQLRGLRAGLCLGS